MGYFESLSGFFGGSLPVWGAVWGHFGEVLRVGSSGVGILLEVFFPCVGWCGGGSVCGVVGGWTFFRGYILCGVRYFGV